jgi:hypothetical protein
MKIEGKPNLNLEITICLNESEARALDALAGYDIESFLSTFYEKIGKSYLHPHEGGLRSLFAAIRQSPNGISATLNRMDECRAVWNGAKRAIDTMRT